MDPAFLTGLPLWLLDLALAGLVYFWNPRKPAHQALAAVVLTVAGWSSCGTVFRASIAGAVQPLEILWGRLGFAFASLIGSSFVIFCQVYPDRQSLSLGKGALFFTLLGAVMAGLCLTPLVLHDVQLTGTAYGRRHYGPLHPVFGVYMLASFGYGLWTLAQKWRTSRGRSRLQLQYQRSRRCSSLVTKFLNLDLLKANYTVLRIPHFERAT